MMDKDKQLELQLKLAWDWFNYHADQRLRAFNFSLILIGAVIVGYASAVREDAAVLGFAVALFGVVVALGFYALDVRNAELVRYGHDALLKLERELGLGILAANLAREQLTAALDDPVGRRVQERIKKADEAAPENTSYWDLPKVKNVSHTYWLRRILWAFWALSFAGVIWAATGFAWR